MQLSLVKDQQQLSFSHFYLLKLLTSSDGAKKSKDDLNPDEKNKNKKRNTKSCYN